MNRIPAWCVTPAVQQGKLSLREGNSWPEGELGLEPEHGHPELSCAAWCLAPRLCDLGQTTSPLGASVSPGVQCRWSHPCHTVSEMTWTKQAAQSWPRAPCTVARVRGAFHVHCCGRPRTIHGQHPHLPQTPHPPRTLAPCENETRGHSRSPLHMPGQLPQVTPDQEAQMPRGPGTAGPEPAASAGER